MIILPPAPVEQIPFSFSALEIPALPQVPRDAQREQVPREWSCARVRREIAERETRVPKASRVRHAEERETRVSSTVERHMIHDLASDTHVRGDHPTHKAPRR